MAGLLIVPGLWPVFDANGDPVSGATIRFYEPGTTTPKAVYSDATLATSLGTQLTTNAGGEPTTLAGVIARLWWAADAALFDVQVTAGASTRTWSGVLVSDGALVSLLPITNITALRATTWPSGRPTLVTLVSNWATGDGGGTFRWDASSTATDNGGTIIKETAVTTGRWIRQYAGEELLASWWPKTEAGLRAAITATPSGGTITIDHDVVSIAAEIAITQAQINIRGLGPRSTMISTSSATANIFTVSGEFVSIEDIGFTSSVTRTGGHFVDAVFGSNRFTLKNYYMENFWVGIRNAAAATTTIQGGMMLNGVAGSGVLIRIDAGFDVSIRDVLADAGANIFAGIYVTAVGDLTIEDCGLVNCGQVIYLVPGAGQVITSAWANNCFFDTSVRSCYIQAAGTIARCIFNQCWFASSQNENIRIETTGAGVIDGLYFSECESYLSASHGISILSSGVKNFRWMGGAVAQNTTSGFNIAANTGEFAIQNTRIGACNGLLGNGTGIIIAAGTSANYQIQGNDLRGNVTAAMTDGGTGTKDIRGNLGYVTKAYGAATVLSAATTAVVAHGMSVTPQLRHCQVSQTASLGAANQMWVSAVNATNITISVNTAPGGDITGSWFIDCERG